MTIKYIPGNGPIYEVAIPFKRSDEMSIDPSAAAVFRERITLHGPVYGELNHPDIDQIDGMQKKFARLNEVDINRAAVVITGAKIEDEHIILRTQAVGNNAKDIESGEFFLGVRGFGGIRKSDIQPIVEVLVTFDLLHKSKVKNPIPFVKISDR